MPTETELKLRIDPKDIKKFCQHALLSTGSPTTQQLRNIYFDTAQHGLLHQGVGLRIRYQDDKRIQTLKTASQAVGGLHQRQEWETPIDTDTPDYNKLPIEQLPQWCQQPKQLKKIKPLFTTDFHRTLWDITFEDNNRIEIALDQGEIKTSKAATTFCEVELELKAGSAEKLYQVALLLQKTVPLILDNHSKAQRGYQLHKPQPLQFYKAAKIKLSTQLTAEEAFCQLLWHCLAHLQANEDMVLYGDDIEGVHQMRVALRRLRSCFNLYSPLIAKSAYRQLRQELKWLANGLGVARDWDVFDETCVHITSIGKTEDMSLIHFFNDKQTQWSALRQRINSLRQQAYTEVRLLLTTPRYTRLMLLLNQWILQRGWRQSLDDAALEALQQPVLHFADTALARYYQRIAQRGQKLSKLNPEQRHDLRILIKKFAYGVRFFSSLYPTSKQQNYNKKLSQLRDELGILNDIHVAMRLMNQVELDNTAPALHFLKGWYTHHYITHLAALEPAWQALMKQKVFWSSVQSGS